MKENGKIIICFWFLLQCSLWAMVIFLVPGLVIGGQTIVPAEKVIFEDKQAGVKIIKTPAGVTLKIIIDKHGRKTVIEVDDGLTQ